MKDNGEANIDKNKLRTTNKNGILKSNFFNGLTSRNPFNFWAPCIAATNTNGKVNAVY